MKRLFVEIIPRIFYSYQCLDNSIQCISQHEKRIERKHMMDRDLIQIIVDFFNPDVK